MSKENKEKAVKIREWFQGIMKSMKTGSKSGSTKNEQYDIDINNLDEMENINKIDQDLIFKENLNYYDCIDKNKNTKAKIIQGSKYNDEYFDNDNKEEYFEAKQNTNDIIINTSSNEHINKNEEEDIEVCNLWKVLSKYQSPFLWRAKFQIYPHMQDNFISHLAAKDIEFVQAKPNLFREITVLLVLSYERSINGETDTAIEELLSSFEKLSEAKRELELQLNDENLRPSGPDGDNEDSDKIEFNKEKSLDSMSKSAQVERINALLQVVHITLAHIAHLRGNLTDALRLLLEPQLLIPLGPIGKATLLAVEGAFMREYGPQGFKKSYELLKQALELDPEYWEWNYYAGKILGGLRRLERSNCHLNCPEIQEIKFLEKSINLYRQNASCLVHLANLYRVLAQQQYRYQTSLESQADQFHPSTLPQIGRKKPIARHQWRSIRDNDPKEELHKVKALPNELPIELLNNDRNYLLYAQDLYKEALSIESLCPYNNARCAKGFWSLPYPYKNKERAQEAILQALRLAPDDTLVNHYAGLFYENVRDDKKSLQCYERAIANNKLNYSAEMSYVNLKLKVSPPGTYSPIFRFEELLFKYPTSQYKIQTLCLKGVYFYKEERLFLQALQCFYNAIHIDPTYAILKRYYPGTYFSKYGEFYNIFQLSKTIAHQIIENPNFSGDIQHFKKMILELEKFD